MSSGHDVNTVSTIHKGPSGNYNYADRLLVLNADVSLQKFVKNICQVNFCVLCLVSTTNIVLSDWCSVSVHSKRSEGL